RRRSEARVAALAAEIHAPSAAALAARSQPRLPARRAEAGVRSEAPRLAAVPSTRQAARWDDDLPLRAPAAQRAGGELFASAHPSSSSRRPLAIAVGIVAAAAVLSAAVLLRGRNASSQTFRAVAAATGDNRSSASSSASPAPLELVALGHERDGDRLVVRGVVRRGATGRSPDGVPAVVFAFNADGGFVTSARAALDADALRSAGETAFAVSVPDAASASRYRVSFRSGDHIVPHVD